MENLSALLSFRGEYHEKSLSSGWFFMLIRNVYYEFEHISGYQNLVTKTMLATTLRRNTRTWTLQYGNVFNYNRSRNQVWLKNIIISCNEVVDLLKKKKTIAIKTEYSTVVLKHIYSRRSSNHPYEFEIHKKISKNWFKSSKISFCFSFRFRYGYALLNMNVIISKWNWETLSTIVNEWQKTIFSI